MKTELTAGEKFQRSISLMMAKCYRDAVSEGIKRGLALRGKDLSTPKSRSVKKSKV